MAKKNRYTAIIKKSKDGMYFGHVQEHPEARSQGVSIDDLKCNLADALREVLEMKKEDDIQFNQGTRTTIPRHTEIDDDFCKDICKQPGIPPIN